ncbi:hypothetical protein JCM3766R1_001946 [Sporobolomyces carnicolor]
MGCAASTSKELDAPRNELIEEELRRTKKELASTYKTLMLGPGESGKSTIVRQMRLLYSRPYSKGERERIKEIVFGNTLQSAQAVISGFDAIDVALPEKLRDDVEYLLSLSPEDATDLVTGAFKAEVADAIRSLVTDPATQEVLQSSTHFQLNDSATYFFDALPRISDSAYLPTDQDILRTRIRSTGIREERFEIEGTKLLVVDVGGQRSERKKWMHLFEDTKLVIFVAAVSEFDQVLYEDESQPRISETLMLWESIANSSWLKRASFVLFLNKRDILEEKLRLNPTSFSALLPDYLGPSGDIESIKHYFLVKFTALHRNTERSLFTSFTSATDTKMMKPVLAGVMQAVLETALAQAGLL